MQRSIGYHQGEAVHIHLALRCRATVTCMCHCRRSEFTALLIIWSDKVVTETRHVSLPCVSSPHLHKGASSQSQCRLEGSQWVATAPRRPSSGTPHSRVYSVTDGCTDKPTCRSGQRNSRHQKENKWVQSEDPLTVMLLYSSSNMSRKISSPWDEFKRRRRRKSLTDHTVILEPRQHLFI